MFTDNDENDAADDLDPHASFLAAIEAQEAGEGDPTDDQDEPADADDELVDDSPSEEDEDDAADADEDSDDDEDQDDEEIDDEDESDEDDAPAADDAESYLIFDEAEGREVFLRAEDPISGETSVYDTREAAKEGFTRILSHVGELTQQIETQKETADTRVAELETELDRYKTVTGMTPEQRLDVEIHSRLPETVKALLVDDDGNAVDPKTLSEEGYGAYRRAVIDAREELKTEIEATTKQRREAKVAKEAAVKEAETHVNSRRRDYKFFGVRNADDRIALDKALTAANELPSAKDKDGNPVKMSTLDVAALLAEEIGTEAADAFLRGVAQPFVKTATKATATKARKVRKAAKTSQPKKASGSSKKKTSGGVNDNPLETFQAAFEAENAA